MGNSIFDENENRGFSCKALISVVAMELPKEVNIDYDSFSSIGAKSENIAIAKLIQLSEIHGEKLPYLFGIALRESNFIWYFEDYFASDWIDREPHRKELIELQNKDQHGSAYAVSNALGMIFESTVQALFRLETPYAERSYDGDILNALAVYWFAKANEETLAGNVIGASELIHEAYSALACIQYDTAFVASQKNTSEEYERLIFSNAKDTKEKASKRGKAAADARHSQPGGSHDKKAAILAIWATGKYWSRDVCAEEECAGIGLSYSKTRTHLIGTPDNPKPRPKKA